MTKTLAPWQFLESHPRMFVVKTLPAGELAITAHDATARGTESMGLLMVWKGTPAAALELVKTLADALSRGAEVDICLNAEHVDDIAKRFPHD